jgi:hypothetical protein
MTSGKDRQEYYGQWTTCYTRKTPWVYLAISTLNQRTEMQAVLIDSCVD